MDTAINICEDQYNETMFIKVSSELNSKRSGTACNLTKVRVGDLTFDGVDSELLHIGDAVGQIGDSIPFDRFGWFYDRNGSETYDGLFEMFTGEDDIYKVSFSTFPFPICLCRSVKSAVGTRREALEIFILDPATDSRAALESSSLKIRWKSI